MNHFFIYQKKDRGFSLIELVVVVGVLAVLSAIAIPSFICFPKRARATAALAALRQIKTECALKKAEAKPEIFTSNALDGYTIQTSGSNSCAGSNGIISAVPDNTNELPTFNLASATESLTYSFRGKTGTNFTECLGLICGEAEDVSRQVNIASIQRLIESKDFAHNETFIERDCSAYVLVDGPTWEDAQSNAKELGANLATINDSDEWEWFKKEYVPDRYAYPDSYNHFQDGEVQLWVGLNDAEKENNHTWISGDPVSLELDVFNFKQGLDKDKKKNKFGVWQWEQQRITYYDNNINQWKKDGWPESAYNIRGIVEIPICE